MNDLGVIDNFMAVFIRYIDSGFGLLSGDVAFLSSTLIAIDVTLAALFWVMGGDDNVLGRLIKKTLYVGAFAFIVSRFSALADIIFRSFAGLGITAGGGAISAADLLKPGRLAGTGFEAAFPLLEQASNLLGFTSFFDNILTIAILLIAWLLVIAAFFILAIQMFVTIIEFKLTTLAGFILIPFAFWNRTAFLAERVLGSVVSSGIKVMVLAVIVGIGSGFFAEFTSAAGSADLELTQAMTLVLASLTLLGLGIFGPGIASGLVAGAPQLGAGAAVGTTALGVGGIAVGAGAVVSGTTAIASAGLGALRAGTAMGNAATTAYALGQETAAAPTIAAGLGGIADAVKGAASAKLSGGLGLGDAAEAGRKAAWNGLNARADNQGSGSATAERSVPPAWATELRARQSDRAARHAVTQSLRDGDRGGASATPDISEKE
jgi:type IV secretion system protein TrbL